MPDGIKLFADKVRTRLEEMERNQAWLADQLGTSPSQISKWLGDGNQPSHPYLLKMSKTLDVSINFLVDDEIPISDRKSIEVQTDPHSKTVSYLLSIMEPAEAARRLSLAPGAR